MYSVDRDQSILIAQINGNGSAAHISRTTLRLISLCCPNCSDGVVVRLGMGLA